MTLATVMRGADDDEERGVGLLDDFLESPGVGAAAGVVDMRHQRGSQAFLRGLLFPGRQPRPLRAGEQTSQLPPQGGRVGSWQPRQEGCRTGSASRCRKRGPSRNNDDSIRSASLATAPAGLNPPLRGEHFGLHVAQRPLAVKELDPGASLARKAARPIAETELVPDEHIPGVAAIGVTAR